MIDYEQSLGSHKISAPNMVAAFRRGFRDSILGGLDWLKGDRDRATDYFAAQFNRVTGADGKYRHNSEAILDRAGYTVGGLLVVCPMGIRDLVSYVLKNRQPIPLEARVLGGVCLVLMGALGVMFTRDFHEVAEGAESATPAELNGVGYRITRSQLGHNLLRIEGLNKFPAATPFEGAQRGRERIERECGPVVNFEDVGPQPIDNLRRVFYVEVPDPNACFPQQ